MPYPLPAACQADQIEDEALIYRLKDGDREACSGLFRRFASSIRNVGRRILRDEDEADDLVQDVFLYLQRKCGLFDGAKGSARSWIFQITYTQAFLRRRQLTSIGFYASGIADTRVESGQRTNQDTDYDQTVEGIFGRSGWKQVLGSLTRRAARDDAAALFRGLYALRRLPRNWVSPTPAFATITIVVWKSSASI